MDLKIGGKANREFILSSFGDNNKVIFYVQDRLQTEHLERKSDNERNESKRFYYIFYINRSPDLSLQVKLISYIFQMYCKLKTKIEVCFCSAALQNSIKSQSKWRMESNRRRCYQIRPGCIKQQPSFKGKQNFYRNNSEGLSCC